jgi:hypothetical protein
MERPSVLPNDSSLDQITIDGSKSRSIQLLVSSLPPSRPLLLLRLRDPPLQDSSCLGDIAQTVGRDAAHG